MLFASRGCGPLGRRPPFVEARGRTRNFISDRQAADTYNIGVQRQYVKKSAPALPKFVARCGPDTEGCQRINVRGGLRLKGKGIAHNTLSTIFWRRELEFLELFFHTFVNLLIGHAPAGAH